MGCIYKRGKIFWIKYSRNGKPIRESTRSKKKVDAKRLLRKREGEISEGKLPGLFFDRVRFDELAGAFIADYEINERKSIKTAKISKKQLLDTFGGLSVTSITTPKIQKYIQGRLETGAAHATVNRELAALKRMLTLGARQTPPKVDRVPFIPMLKANNIRKGFFEHGDFLKVRDALPEHLKPFVTFGYKSGWRLSEISTLKWSMVDLQNSTVSLEVGETKNEDARTIFLDDELNELFQSLKQNRRTLLPWVFLNLAGTDRVKRFDKAWKTACKEAKIGQRYFHDLRRTAVRNMVRSGIPERVAMTISGHKSRSVFERYNIVDEKDLRLAAERLQNHLASQACTATVTVVDLKDKKASNIKG